MKKFLIKLLSAALLLTAIPLTMASCSKSAELLRMEEAERAEAFYELIEKNADGAQSSFMTQTTTMKMYLFGELYEQTTEGTITFISEEDDFTFLQQLETTVNTGGEEILIYEDTGYADGYMFIYNKEEGHTSGLKSPISAAEYDAFKGEQSKRDPEMLVGEGYTETMTCVQNEDKTWTATYTDFTEEGMKPFYRMIAGIEYAVTDEHSLKGVKMTCQADEDLYPTSIVLEYIFEENPEAESGLPELKVETRYEGWNNTVLAEPYDISNFTEVEDLRPMELFLDALQDREIGEAGAFTASTVATTRYNGQSETNRFEQDVTYHSYRGMAFTMDYSQSGYDIHSEYKNGTMTTTVRTANTGEIVQNETAELRNFEAQSMVQQLMNSEDINGVDITCVTVTDGEKGQYRFTLGDAVKAEMNEAYQSAYGKPIDTFTGHIDAVVVDGVLESYKYEVGITMDMEGKPLTVTVTLTVTFTEVLEDGAPV